MYISDVFERIQGLARQAIEELKKHGLKFHKDGTFKWTSTQTCDYLRDPNTPEYVRLTCFALEMRGYIRVDNASLEKYSLALLLVVGFSLDQPDDVRRHALAVLR